MASDLRIRDKDRRARFERSATAFEHLICLLTALVTQPHLFRHGPEDAPIWKSDVVGELDRRAILRVHDVAAVSTTPRAAGFHFL